MKSFYVLYACFSPFTTTRSLAEDFDALASIFAPDADNVEELYSTTLLDSDDSLEPQTADTSIFDDTGLGSLTSESQENLFSTFSDSDDSINLALMHPTSAVDSIFATSDLFSSTQDIDSIVLVST